MVDIDVELCKKCLMNSRRVGDVIVKPMLCGRAVCPLSQEVEKILLDDRYLLKLEKELEG